MIRISPYSRLILIASMCMITSMLYAGEPAENFPIDSLQNSTPADALRYLDQQQNLEQSTWWPNVDPKLLLTNLRTFTVSPLKFYEGKNTNFCSYSALTYIPLSHDPRGFAEFMIELYKNGKARMGTVNLRPGKAVRSEAGLLKYKGALDITPAAQMWYLTLADHFKGYLNTFNRRFHKGDENRMWASTNLGKFNRMLQKLFLVKVESHGSDLIRPRFKNLYEYLSTHTSNGPVFVYLNNRLLNRKNHVREIFSIPTHFILLLNISRAGEDKVNITYWDYGNRTLQQLDESFLKKITFGVSVFSFSGL